MSNLKVIDGACSDVAKELKTAELALENAISEIDDYVSSLPSATQINSRINSMATRKNELGVEEVDDALYGYYFNKYGASFNLAKHNINTLRSQVNIVNNDVIDADERLVQVAEKVAEFQETSGSIGDPVIDIPPETPTNGGNPFAPGGGGGGGETVPPEDPTVSIDDDDGKGDGSEDLIGIDVTDPKPDNNDGIGKIDIDTNGDNIPDVNVDTNKDGIADTNIDTNGDLVPDINIDTNGDGKPDLNIDTDGDRIPDLNIDTNGDGKPDLNIDTDGDRLPELNIDTNGDGKPDLNIDTNGDGKPDLNIDINGDGKPDVNIDINGDGKPDLNLDLDGDGYADTNIDINGDGKPDINVDTDGNGIPDKNVIPNYEHNSGNGDGGSFLSDLLKRMKFEVDDDGNVLYYDESGNVVYPFLGDGIFSNPANAQKFKLGENAFLELLDGPEKGDAVESLDLDTNEEIASATFAVGGMAAVGAAAANAAATMKRTKDEIKDGFRAYEYDYDYDDDAKLTDEQYKKRKTGTIISMVLLTLLIVANAIALIVEGTADVTIVLLGLAISITAIITSMGIKFGKFYTVCAIIINLLLVFIITSLDLTTGLGYIISYAVVIVVLLYYYFSKVFERILPMFNYVPAVVAIVGIGFVGLTNVFAITNWWVSLILVVLLVAGYFAYNYYGIASLEEQAELEKQKGLNVYDYFNLRTNKVDWKNKNVSNQVNTSINTANKNGNKFVTKELDEKKDDIKNFFK